MARCSFWNISEVPLYHLCFPLGNANHQPSPATIPMASVLSGLGQPPALRSQLSSAEIADHAGESCFRGLMRVEARLERVGGEERETVGVDSFSTSLALKGRRIRVVAARSFVVKSFFFF